MNPRVQCVWWGRREAGGGDLSVSLSVCVYISDCVFTFGYNIASFVVVFPYCLCVIYSMMCGLHNSWRFSFSFPCCSYFVIRLNQTLKILSAVLSVSCVLSCRMKSLPMLIPRDTTIDPPFHFCCRRLTRSMDKCSSWVVCMWNIADPLFEQNPDLVTSL